MNKSAGYKEKKEGEEWEWKDGGGAADVLMKYDDVGLPGGSWFGLRVRRRGS